MQINQKKIENMIKNNEDIGNKINQDLNSSHTDK